MGSGSTNTTTSFRSGWWLAVLMSLFALVVTGTVMLLTPEFTPRTPAEIEETLPVLLSFNLFVFVITLLVGHQRVELDTAAGTFRYANLSTWHRWRVVRADRVELMQLESATETMNVLIDSVYLRQSPDGDDAPPVIVRLLDRRIGPVSWTRKDSALFVAVHDLIRNANPTADLRRALYANKPDRER